MIQPNDSRERLRAGDDTLWERAGLSYNEKHALVLGTSVGYSARRAGRPGVALAVLLATVFYPPLGPRSIGLQSLQHEPWYAAAGVLLGWLLGR